MAAHPTRGFTDMALMRFMRDKSTHP